LASESTPLSRWREPSPLLRRVDTAAAIINCRDRGGWGLLDLTESR
jgi:hypothetical protein